MSHCACELSGVNTVLLVASPTSSITEINARIPGAEIHRH
jgi:uncharacterized protein YqkB